MIEDVGHMARLYTHGSPQLLEQIRLSLISPYYLHHGMEFSKACLSQKSKAEMNGTVFIYSLHCGVGNLFSP